MCLRQCYIPDAVQINMFEAVCFLIQCTYICTSSCMLICVLASISILTISTCPLNEAVISGVQPLYSVSDSVRVVQFSSNVHVPVLEIA